MSSLTEARSFCLRADTAFNPMLILEVLKQACASYSHHSKHTWKAYQEKENYKVFYMIGGWQSDAARSSYLSSETDANLRNMLDPFFEVPGVLLIALDAAELNNFQKPILVIQQLIVSDKDAWNQEYLATSHGGEMKAGEILAGDGKFQLAVLSNWQTLDQSKQALEAAGPLAESIAGARTRHLELNRFI